MKIISSILAVAFLPLLALSQAQNVPSVSLKTLDEKTVLASDIVKGDKLTLLYFFDEYSRDLADNFEYLENMDGSANNTGNIKVIAIYNASNGTYGKLRPFLSGNSIDLETYIDVNGELQRSMGLPANSSILLCGDGQEFSARYSELTGYSNTNLDQVVSQILDEHNTNTNYNGGGQRYKAARLSSE